jgi:S1-C subfamily serine protease
VRLLRLRFATGARRGEELIFSGPRVRFGRSRDNTLVLTDSDAPHSSGHHAEATRERGAWFIVDTGSTNGTFVNDVSVQRARLRRGDVVRLGDDQFVVGDRSRIVTALGAVAAAALFALTVGWIAVRRQPAIAYEQLAQRAARSVYAVVVDENGTQTFIGTAFAVSPGLLATSAHVAVQLAGHQGAAIVGDTFEKELIAGVDTHPGWHAGSLEGDVALLRLVKGPAVPLPLADDGGFRKLRRGASVASFGFPAASTHGQRPRGRLAIDVVGDVRGDYLEAGLSIAPGTSGSPVFDARGSVVAIVAGGDFQKGPDGRVVPSGSRVNWAISVDRVREMIPIP